MKHLKSGIIIIIGIILAGYSCKKENKPNIDESSEQKWNIDQLRDRTILNQDSSKWNLTLLNQDKETYNNYATVFEQYPLSNHPFPIADYDYAVFSNPFTIKIDSIIFKGIQIGEYKTPDSDSIITKLVLIVLTNDENVAPETFVNSRNFPYLTAEGFFHLKRQNFKWVFQATPDGFSSLFFSMKLFDLRFGQTIIIYPQQDNSFLYKQVNESPNNYFNFDDYIKTLEKAIIISSL